MGRNDMCHDDYINLIHNWSYNSNISRNLILDTLLRKFALF
jgi:hypothetical protein